MRNKRHVLAVALLCGPLFLVLAARRAEAQAVPPGSYQKSCKGISVAGVKLQANCFPGDATGPGGFSVLADFYECEGDIGVKDNRLECSRNPNNPLLRQARASIDFGLRNVLNTTKTSAFDNEQILAQIFNDGMLPRFYAGLTAEDAAGFFEKILASPSQFHLRARVIEDAFKDVYGFGASPKDMAFWNAELQRKAGGYGGYSHIIIVERQKLNADKVIRRLVISNAYRKALGRMPTAGDFDYWMPRNQTFKELVEANRAWLYSPAGANDLVETVKRALEGKGGDKPTIKQINDAVIKHSQAKAIYDEM